MVLNANTCRVRFQSTLSMRRATYAEHLQLTIVDKFQSTLSMRRATGRSIDGHFDGQHFNPRSP